jgi:hypothetical protein
MELRMGRCTGVPVLLATIHVRLDRNAKDRLLKVEVYLIYLFLFTPDAVAESIGWPKGNPFQQEMGWGLSPRAGETAFERRR